MPILDSILPNTLDPMMKNVVNGLVIVHLMLFVLFVIMVCRSFFRGPTDHFKEQVGHMEK